MAQSTDNTLSNQSGASFRTELNSILGAHLSSHKGGSEPSYITTGAFWIDDTSTPWIYKVYDGAASFGFMEINPSTNNVTLINVKDGDARTEGASIGQIQDSAFHVLGSVSGTNTITASLTPAITAYAAGQRFTFIPAAANTGAATININSVSAKALQINGQALVGGELGTSDAVDIVYDGTQFQIVSPTSNQPIKGLRFPDQGELTISSGAVTVTGVHHTIDTESDAASDDLDTINGGSDGQILIIRAENAARTVVIKDGTGNIETPDGEDITLDEVAKEVMLKYDGAQSDWHVVSAPSSAAGGGGLNINGMKTNQYYLGLGYVTSSDTQVIVANRAYYKAYVSGFSDTPNRIGIDVTAASSSGSMRLALYEFANGVPTTLIEDFGAVSTSTTGVKEITISRTLDASTVYALWYCADENVTLRKCLNDGHKVIPSFYLGTESLTFSPEDAYVSFTFGAAPSTFTGTPTYVAANPAIWLRKV